jgi:hypothetical protein
VYFQLQEDVVEVVEEEAAEEGVVDQCLIEDNRITNHFISRTASNMFIDELKYGLC